MRPRRVEQTERPATKPMPQAPTKKRRATTRGWPPSRSRLEQPIQEAITDTHNEYDPRPGVLTLIADNLVLPFETKVLGSLVTVEQINLGMADDIVAICRRGKKQQAIPILDLPLPRPPPAGAEWIEAYRRWVRGR